MTQQMRVLWQPIPISFLLLMVGLSQVPLLKDYWFGFFYCATRFVGQVLVSYKEPHWCVGNNLTLCGFLLPFLIVVKWLLF